jgi:predicted flap endonuclease-1-like 5' DNA nuclease
MFEFASPRRYVGYYFSYGPSQLSGELSFGRNIAAGCILPADLEETMTFFYVLLAFIIGVAIGWYLWGRQRSELDNLRRNLDSTRGERDRLKADTARLNGELDACGRVRADLGRQLSEATANQTKAASSPAALVSGPATSDTPSPVAPKKSEKRAAKPAKAKAATRSTKAKATKSSAKDDLRGLIGIGPVNERKLNEHGVTSFAQIAAWTAVDVKRVEEYLEFDGRIERERWVEQAKLLAAGDEQEFARRFPTAGSANNS